MFAKLQRQIERKNKHKTPKKFRFDVTITSLEGIPATIKSCRIVWTRGSRTQTTKTTSVINGRLCLLATHFLTQTCSLCRQYSKLAGVAHWREPLSQISTIYTDAQHATDVEEKVHQAACDSALEHNTNTYHKAHHKANRRANQLSISQPQSISQSTLHSTSLLLRTFAVMFANLQEYIFKVQATTQLGQDEDRLITVGKVKIDMAQYATLGHKEHQTILQMPFSLGRTFTQALPFGQLRLKISAPMVKVSCHAPPRC